MRSETVTSVRTRAARWCNSRSPGRDVSYQRGFPLAADPGSLPVDRGHLIPNLSGGEFGPNIFRQDRSLNRGWSQEGRRFRALEREAAAIPGVNAV